MESYHEAPSFHVTPALVPRNPTIAPPTHHVTSVGCCTKGRLQLHNFSGHGGPTAGMWPHKHFLCFMQCKHFLQVMVKSLWDMVAISTKPPRYRGPRGPDQPAVIQALTNLPTDVSSLP
ncbi:uncharacterized protein LOC142577693 [Dermacentor variabilis]|uniref:uncharacterized protein LOC142577693 n=1 Tax=Dermacentor variabilis TaxID=34621 RepID=UPI003F5C201B